MADGMSCALAKGRPECEPTAAKDVRVRLTEYHCHGGTGRQAGYEDSPLIDAVRPGYLANHSGDHRRLALVSLLIARLEPVPALGHVGACGLLRVENQESVLFGQPVHLRSTREIIC
jgi:hypothetical protein